MPCSGRADDAVLSDLSSSDEDAPQIKAGHPSRLTSAPRGQVPLSKDEALAAVQRSKVLKGLSIPGQAGRGSFNGSGEPRGACGRALAAGGVQTGRRAVVGRARRGAGGRC